MPLKSCKIIFVFLNIIIKINILNYKDDGNYVIYPEKLSLSGLVWNLNVEKSPERV